MVNRLTLIILALCACGTMSSWAQNVTIVNTYAKDTTGKSLNDFRLAKSQEHRIIINYYEPATTSEIDQLTELVGAALNFYIDQSVKVEGAEVTLKKSKSKMLADMKDIVKSAVKFYEFKELKTFNGFSKQVEEKIAALENLDFEKSPFAAKATDAASRKKMEYYFVQKELNDLKLLANVEVGNFSNDNLLVFTDSDQATVDQATKDKLLSQMEFDPNAPLNPVKINYSNETLELLGYDDPSSLYPDKVKPSNNDGGLASQVLKMLEINNSKMDAMQVQINDLRADQLAMMEAKQNEKNTEMQSQIDDLRGMVIDLVRMNTGSSLATNGNGGNISPTPNYNTVSNVPTAVNIFFAKGITKPDVASKMALNEVVDILARNPRLKLIITGFADKSGSALDNLLISQERAREVKQFLSASGLTEDRFITKYFGDRDSQAESAGDRKVVLEFVQ